MTIGCTNSRGPPRSKSSYLGPSTDYGRSSVAPYGNPGFDARGCLPRSSQRFTGETVNSYITEGESSVTSQPIRDPIADHLLTPQNSALLVIDYQPPQLSAVKSMDRDLLMKNAASTIKLAQVFDVPIVHSTVNVGTGENQPTLPPLAELLRDNVPVD